MERTTDQEYGSDDANGAHVDHWFGWIDLDRFDTAAMTPSLYQSTADPGLGIALASSPNVIHAGDSKRTTDAEYATDAKGATAPVDAIWVAINTVDARAIRFWRRRAATIHWVRASEAALRRLADRLAAHQSPRAAATYDTQHKDQPIADWVAETLHRAIEQTASDVHFEPFEQRFRVRIRVDGVLHTLVEPNDALRAPAIAHLKVIAGLDAAERRLPQDGRTTHRFDGTDHDLRISTLPTMHGEKVVARVLAGAGNPLSIDQLGLFRSQREALLAALVRPQGMILVTGPTGSGKTATLYAALGHLNVIGRNLATVEDPIEVHVDGINQVQVDERIGMTFARALRALLRQDPDVLMVGEIRDPETADVAVKAAQTGHLVLATLHSNSAAEAFARLRGLGIAEADVRDCVDLVIAQRLVRLLCAQCKKRTRMPTGQPSLSFDDANDAFRANRTGCPACLSGYRHRKGIYELASPTSKVPEMTLQQAGSARLSRGETSFEELERVLGSVDGT